MTETKSGKLIVIEGTDASGKETQTELLRQKLLRDNIQAQSISFPRYETPTGKIVGICYLGKALPKNEVGCSWFAKPTELDPLTASLYYAADRREAAPQILKILNSGIHLISNRYVESNMGHQGGKIRDESHRKRLFEKLDCLEHEILEIPRPNAVVFLYMPWKVTKELNKERGGHQDAHEASEEHLINAEEAYLQLSRLRKWERIDCAPHGFPPHSINEISAEVYDRVKPLLEK